MSQIIHTRPTFTGGSGGSSITPTEVTIDPSDTELLQTYDGTDCPFVTWNVSVSDRVSMTQRTAFFKITALHDYEGNVTNNRYSVLGADFDITITVAVGTPNTNITLSLTNNEAFALDICVLPDR